jgi:hypothetical protein
MRVPLTKRTAVPPQSAHESRVVDEERELDERLRKLTAFTLGPVFHTLPQEDQDLLLIQRAQMAAYGWTLKARINRF